MMIAISADARIIRENDVVFEEGFPVTVLKIFPVNEDLREILVKDSSDTEYITVSMYLKTI